MNAAAMFVRELSAHPWQSAGYLLLVWIAAEYWKVFPLMYHIRVILTMCNGRLSTPFVSIGDKVFTAHRVTLGDRDWNGHQNNSCYNLEIDVVRYEWALRFMRHSAKWWSWYAGQGIKIANGGVSMYFLREMRYGQSYNIVTRLTHADKKWLYLQSDFVHPRTQVVFATGLSRIVFKAGNGRTIPPAEVLETLGYGPVDQYRDPSRAASGHGHGSADFYLEDQGADDNSNGEGTPVPTPIARPSPKAVLGSTNISTWPGSAMTGLLESLQARVAGQLPVPSFKSATVKKGQ